MKPVPARLEPVFDRRLWGMRNLAPLFPEFQNEDAPIAEAWLTGDACSFANGPFAGRELGAAWREMPPEWRGERCRNEEQIPLLVKFLFCGDRPSIQVHPDDAYARRHEAAAGGHGKTEMWHFVAARSGAELLHGLRPDVTPASFRCAIAAGTVEGCMERLLVEAGDTVFVPAGTVHTLGAGTALCEIQEQSDITYRIFDFHRLGPDGKPRPLQIEKALEVIHFGERPGGKIAPVRIARGRLVTSYLAACRYFATEKWEFDERIGGVTSRATFELLIFLSGAGRIEWGGESEEYARAQLWFLPASLGPYQLEPSAPTALLRTYVPDLDAFVQRLRDLKILPDEWSRLVFP
jgi:mannose-6-phosphate isomerase